jgi:peptidoglycan/xylan/chitin deacetylase (PgdA/CDA1 family)
LAVTFDDGYLSVLEQALPILARLDLPGTIFVPTSLMDQRQPLRWPGVDHWAATPYAHELQGMNWDDLRSLADDGWEIGSHTRTHPRLTELDQQAADRQLLESRLECSERLGRPCTSLAYPYGDTDGRITDAAGRAGYLAAAGLSSSLAARGPLRWPRVGIYHRDHGWRFRLKANTAVRRLRATRLWSTRESTSSA